MFQRTLALIRKVGGVALLTFAACTSAQTLEWNAVKFFKYNIENVTVISTAPGTWAVRTIFSVTNPIANTTWDIKNALPFSSAGASVTLDIGWDPKTDLTNTGSANQLLTSLSSATLGAGVAIPVQVRNLQGPAGVAHLCVSLAECPGAASLINRYWVEAKVTPVTFTQAVTVGRVALEGRPVCNGVSGFGYTSCPPGPTPTTFVNIPVTSATADFLFQPTDHALVSNQRRQIVDIAKCKGCHDDRQHGDVIVPKLSLHGANRNENISLCVVCHNPNQTDVPYRTLTTTTGAPADPKISGPEAPIDFKVMVHAIHSGGFRKSPYVVIGRNSSINDYSDVRFPRELRKSCPDCHIDANGKGTFELPLKSTVLGTTVKSQSVYQVAQAYVDPVTGASVPGQTRIIDVNPFNDVKVSPIAATCSACHDNSEVRSHMVRTGGASFATTQAAIGVTVRERCASCHGPGKDKSVRKAHELGGGSSESD